MIVNQVEHRDRIPLPDGRDAGRDDLRLRQMGKDGGKAGNKPLPRISHSEEISN